MGDLSILSQIALPVAAGVGIVSASARIRDIVMSRPAAQECANTFKTSLKTFDRSDCPRVRMPIVVMSEAQMPGIGEHVQMSQSAGSPSILHRTFIAKLPNRAAAMVKCRFGLTVPVLASGSSCDEYPFASSMEGGAGEGAIRESLNKSTDHAAAR